MADFTREEMRQDIRTEVRQEVQKAVDAAIPQIVEQIAEVIRDILQVMEKRFTAIEQQNDRTHDMLRAMNARLDDHGAGS